MTYLICGYHTVKTCLEQNKRKVLKVYLNNQENKFHEIYKFQNKINIVDVKSDFFNSKLKLSTFAHQKIAAEVEGLDKLSSSEYLKNKLIKKVICLDQLTDQRNIGSILRSAVAFGYDSILISKRDFDEKNIGLNKTASGAVDLLNIFVTSNVKNDLKIFKNNFFDIVSLSEKSNIVLNKKNISEKHVLIFGSEEFGIRKSVLSLSDYVFKININSKINSLNVSNSASAAMAILSH